MVCSVPGYVVVLSSTVVSDCKQMARESSVSYTLGKEFFLIAGHEICIRESLDSYGALVWPGVSSKDTQ